MPVAFGVLAPYVTFLVGVIIADLLCLYPEMRRTHLYLRPLPVGLFAVSFLMLNGFVVVSGTDTASGLRQEYYGHLQSMPHFLMFCATTMFAGTYAPGVFPAYRTILGGGTSAEERPRRNETGSAAQREPRPPNGADSEKG